MPGLQALRWIADLGDASGAAGSSSASGLPVGGELAPRTTRVIGADGTGLTGTFAVAVKNGNLAGGNGVYGEGNVCLFGGAVDRLSGRR